MSQAQPASTLAVPARPARRASITKLSAASKAKKVAVGMKPSEDAKNEAMGDSASAVAALSALNQKLMSAIENGDTMLAMKCVDDGADCSSTTVVRR